MMLLLSCDLRAGLSATRGGITEASFGLGSFWAVPLLWIKLQTKLMETRLSRDIFSAERLYNIGFLNIS